MVQALNELAKLWAAAASSARWNLPLRRSRRRTVAVASVLGLAVLSVAGCEGAVLEGALGDAKHRGVLRIATVNAPTTYFIGREGPAGYEYDLARAFAAFLGLDIEVVTRPDEAAVLEAVDRGEADLAAAGLIMTPARLDVRRFVHYRETLQLVVCRTGGAARTASRDLAAAAIDVARGSSHEGAVWRLEEAGVLLNWRLVDHADDAAMLAAVSSGQSTCVLTDRAAYALNRRYYPRLRSVAQLPGGQRIGWAVTGRQGWRGEALAGKAEEWLRMPDTVALLDALEEKYFGFRPEDIDSNHAAAFLRAIDTRLDRWRALFEDAAADADVSWTLLAAVAYQESHWEADAVSPTGVRGLLMLTRATARSLGVRDRRDPVQSARGGARYLRQLRERLPASIPEDDRWWFAAASYNIGYGHVLDARALARERGLDPDRWADVRDMLPLLEDPAIHPGTRYGYARGREAQTYVRRVRDYADILEKRFDAGLTLAQEP